MLLQCPEGKKRRVKGFWEYYEELTATFSDEFKSSLNSRNNIYGPEHYIGLKVVYKSKKSFFLTVLYQSLCL